MPRSMDRDNMISSIELILKEGDFIANVVSYDFRRFRPVRSRQKEEWCRLRYQHCGQLELLG